MQTIYEQHARASPILSDILLKCTQDRQEQGDLIIIGMDLNDPVQRHDHTHFFEELHMKEEILTIHSGTSPPVTNIRNESNYPIYAIYGVIWD